ncbi:hypothetical protein BTVI_149209 [Pitangus sulphuratus]|nr:hypothetical protein BTVI_149209 [Pitangus sulphuratus]
MNRITLGSGLKLINCVSQSVCAESAGKLTTERISPAKRPVPGVGSLVVLPSSWRSLMCPSSCQVTEAHLIRMLRPGNPFTGPSFLPLPEKEIGPLDNVPLPNTTWHAKQMMKIVQVKITTAVGRYQQNRFRFLIQHEMPMEANTFKMKEPIKPAEKFRNKGQFPAYFSRKEHGNAFLPPMDAVKEGALAVAGLAAAVSGMVSYCHDSDPDLDLLSGLPGLTSDLPQHCRFNVWSLDYD